MKESANAATAKAITSGLPNPRPRTSALKETSFIHFSLWSIGIAIALLSGLFRTPTCQAAQGMPQLDNEIGVLQSSVTQLSGDLSNAFATLHLNLGGLVTGGIVMAKAGSTISWPLFFIASSFSVTGVQVDVVLPSSFTVVSVSTGPVAASAGKSVSTSVVNGTQRIIVFGLNQMPLTSGVVAIAQLKIGAVPSGKLCPFGLINPIGTDANGNTVLMSAESGDVQIQ